MDFRFQGKSGHPPDITAMTEFDPKATWTRQQGPLGGNQELQFAGSPWHERVSLRLLSAELYCVGQGVEEVAGASRATPGSADGLAPILPAIVSTPYGRLSKLHVYFQSAPNEPEIAVG